ncbi:MAG: nuclear transport factor 2 family protein [Pseudonocardiaceae bacterium]
MSDLYDVPAADPFSPSAEDTASVTAWFARYDRLVADGDVEAMADMAVFPLNVVSDSPGGDGAAVQWSREQFVHMMSEVLAGSGDVKLDSQRTPYFLTGSLVLVITDATMTATGAPQQALRYADLLIRRDGGWAFQTMVQGGWGDAL